MALYGLTMILEGIVRLFSFGIINVNWAGDFLFWGAMRRYQRLMQVVQGYILPTAQIAAQQGTIVNVPELARDFAQYLGISNMDDWYQSMVPADTAMNPYSPMSMQGQVAGGGQTDNRFQSDTGSNFNNQIQEQNRAGGESSQPAIGATTQGQ